MPAPRLCPASHNYPPGNHLPANYLLHYFPDPETNLKLSGPLIAGPLEAALGQHSIKTSTVDMTEIAAVRWLCGTDGTHVAVWPPKSGAAMGGAIKPMKLKLVIG